MGNASSSPKPYTEWWWEASCCQNFGGLLWVLLGLAAVSWVFHASRHGTRHASQQVVDKASIAPHDADAVYGNTSPPPPVLETERQLSGFKNVIFPNEKTFLYRNRFRFRLRLHHRVEKRPQAKLSVRRRGYSSRRTTERTSRIAPANALTYACTTSTKSSLPSPNVCFTSGKPHAATLPWWSSTRPAPFNVQHRRPYRVDLLPTARVQIVDSVRHRGERRPYGGSSR